jgi:Flp pilus assembly pilin Flp
MTQMHRFIQALWRDDDGVLSFEWTLVAVLIVFGIVGGLAAARDVIIDELGDLSQAVVAFDQSFSYSGITTLGIPGSSYTDVPGVVDDSMRQPAGSWGIAGRDDSTDGA